MYTMNRIIELIEEIYNSHDKEDLKNIEFDKIVNIVSIYEKNLIKYDYDTKKLNLFELAK